MYNTNSTTQVKKSILDVNKTALNNFELYLGSITGEIFSQNDILPPSPFQNYIFSLNQKKIKSERLYVPTKITQVVTSRRFLSFTLSRALNSQE